MLLESYSILQNSLFYSIHKVDIGILSSVSLCCIICTNINGNIYFSTRTMSAGRGIYSNVLYSLLHDFYQVLLRLAFCCLCCRKIPSNMFCVMAFFFSSQYSMKYSARAGLYTPTCQITFSSTRKCVLQLARSKDHC